MRSLNWKLISLGVLLYFLSTLFLMGVLIVGTMLVMAIRGVPMSRMDTAIQTVPNLLLALMLGIATAVWGGFISTSGSLTERAAIKNSLAFGIIALILMVLLSFGITNDDSAETPLWYDITFYLTHIPAAFSGGWWRWRNLSRANRVLETPQSPFPEVPRKL